MARVPGMDDEGYGDDELIRELADRVAALENSVAFLEVWCEEQQDILDREHPWCAPGDERILRRPAKLYVVDLRDGTGYSDHERRVRSIRDRIEHLRHDLTDRLGARAPEATS